MKKPIASGGESLLVAQLAAAISIAAFFYYLRHNDLLLYGDAVAHINIARRVFDSRTPGPLQLGTVWLPLPHLVMLPFLLSRWMWQTGIGGSIPSMIAYVFSVLGIFRLVQSVIPASIDEDAKRTSQFAAWLAAGIFALNPNLIYLQATAMTEPLYLALFVWAAVFFAEFVRSSSETQADLSLTHCGLCLACACLTRYDGWLLAAVICAGVLVVSRSQVASVLRPKLRNLFVLAAAAPILWLAYNAAVYRNPLEFANGPYSAKAIEQRTAVPGFPLHPGTANLPLAFKYFFKSAQLNMGNEGWQFYWVSTLLLGTGIVLLFQRKLWPLLLLWTPAPFYMLSVAYSGVPIFIPVWWPFSRYNARYGIEMLPAFAVFTAIAVYGLMRFASSTKPRLAIAGVAISLTIVSYVQEWRAQSVVFQEAVINSRSRVALEDRLALQVAVLPADSTFLLYLGDHAGAFQRAGVPFSQTINEGNHRPWVQPADPDGLWEKALRNPGAYADFVIASDGDAVATNANKSELQPIEVIHVSGQPAVTLYRALKSNRAR